MIDAPAVSTNPLSDHTFSDTLVGIQIQRLYKYSTNFIIKDQLLFYIHYKNSFTMQALPLYSISAILSMVAAE